MSKMKYARLNAIDVFTIVFADRSGEEIARTLACMVAALKFEAFEFNQEVQFNKFFNQLIEGELKYLHDKMPKEPKLDDNFDFRAMIKD